MAQCVAPPFLNPGDTIGLIAPARKISREELNSCVELIEKQGYLVKFASNIGMSEGQFSGTDIQRAQGMNEFVKDPKVKAVLAARGGYGSVRTFDHIDHTAWKQNPTWLCGFSDVTALHLLSRCDFNIQSIHSPVASSLTSATEKAQQSFFDALSGNLSWKFKHETVNMPANKVIEGELVGGNLSLIYSLMGSRVTNFQRDHVLLIEDLDEMLYHLDRMLMGLKLAQLFQHTKAVVIGGMSDFRDNTKEHGFSSDNPYGKSAKDILIEQLQALNIPLVFGAPFGHVKNNQSFYHGAQAKLEWKEEFLHLTYS